MNTKTKQQEIQAEITNLKIKSERFEKWGKYSFFVVIIFTIIKTFTFLNIFVEHSLWAYFSFINRGFVFRLTPIIVICIFLFGYAAFLRQKQNLLFKELELLINHQIEFPTT